MFTFIYCMPIIYTIVILVSACYLWKKLSLKIKNEQLKKWKIFNFVLFVVGTACVVYITVFARKVEVDKMNLIPFHSIIDVLNGANIELLRSSWMNCLLFVPGSMWLHYIFSKQSIKKRVLQIMFFVFISICIEFVQGYFKLGVVEVDDVIHNTMGAIIGTTSDLWSVPLVTFIRNTLLKTKNKIVKR